MSRGGTRHSLEQRLEIVTKYLSGQWSPVNKIDNLNRDFLPMLRLSFELEFGTHLQTALVI